MDIARIKKTLTDYESLTAFCDEGDHENRKLSFECSVNTVSLSVRATKEFWPQIRAILMVEAGKMKTELETIK